jgi:glyoxylase-like metal-dependent hydrolase (beta-lactamase superfamily II)
MAEYIALGNGVYCIDALYVQPQVASIYLLREADEVAIIETGTYHSVDNVLATLEDLGISKSQVKYVIPTHVHLDHAGGAGEMMKHFASASLIIHPRGAAHMINPEKLIAGTIGVYGEATFKRLYGTIEPIDKDRVIVADDGAIFELNNRQLVFFDTQGHARHHFCIYDAHSNGVFTGDTFGVSYAAMKRLERGLIPSTPPTQFDPDALHASIVDIMSYEPQRLFLTHYGEFTNPAAQVDSFNRWIDAYVELCRQMDPSSDDAEPAFKVALGDMVLDGLPSGDNRSEISRILEVDIRLNAQGLAHWWRTRKND